MTLLSFSFAATRPSAWIYRLAAHAIIFIFSFGNSLAQSPKDSLLISDGRTVIEELTMMWNYDQALREYAQYQTFDKHVIDSIERLDAGSRKRVTDSLSWSKVSSDRLWATYITPMDHVHTKRMIELIRKYGFPSVERFQKLLGARLKFHPYMLLLHAPKEYWNELKLLVEEERKAGNFPDRCSYGHLLWSLNGRSNLKYFLENGYVFVKNPDGSQTMTAKNCD